MSIQDKFNRANVIYKITKDIDLGGETLTIPEGCTLDFQGGSFSNGIIVGNNTIICSEKKQVFFNVKLENIFANDYIHSSWVGVNENKSDNTEELLIAISVCNSSKVPLFLDKGHFKVTAPIHLPKYGVKGINSKLSVLVYDGIENVDDLALFIYGEPNDYSYQSNIEDIGFSVTNEDITNDVVAICTPSRGARMKDCSISTGSGACVSMYQCYYYEYNNVAFSGKWRAEGHGYKGQGFVFAKDNHQINNVTFNKCDFKDLQDLCIINIDVFKGSNTIRISDTAIERFGRGLGALNSMHVVFESCYIEGLCKDGNYTNYSIAKTGVGDVVFNNCLLNFYTVPTNIPLFLTLVGNVLMDNNTLQLPSEFNSVILANPSYSTKGALYISRQDVNTYNGKYNRHISNRTASQHFNSVKPSYTVYAPILIDSQLANKTTELLLRKAQRQYNSTGYWALEKNPFQLAINPNSRFYLEIDVSMSIFYEGTSDYSFIKQKLVASVGGVAYTVGEEVNINRVETTREGNDYISEYNLLKLVCKETIEDGSLALFNLISPQIQFSTKHDGIAKNMYSNCKIRIIPFDGVGQASYVY